MISLQDNENIICTVRKHWFVFLSEIISTLFVCILLPIVFSALYFVLKDINVITGDITALIIVLGSLIMLLLWTTIFIVWTDFYLDIIILTDKQVIDIQQKGLFFREITTTHLDKIQDVSSSVDGIIQTYFGFGTLHIENAGEDRDFIIYGVPNPTELRQKISEQQGLHAKGAQTMNLSEESVQKMREAIQTPTDR